MKELMFFDANCRIGSYYNGGGVPDEKPCLAKWITTESIRLSCPVQ